MTDFVMPESGLKPCPFCGAYGVELGLFCDPAEGLDNSGPSRRIQCFVCHVEAPFYDTEAEAITAWNNRAAPAPTAGGGEQLDRLFYGGGEYVRADEAVRTICDLQGQLSALQSSPAPSGEAVPVAEPRRLAALLALLDANPTAYASEIRAAWLALPEGRSDAE